MALAENDIQLKKLTLKEYCRACHKFRDVVLFAVFSLVLALAFIIWVGSDASTREYFRNMELALRQCGAMVQNGEKDALSLKIKELLESETFRHNAWGGFTWQAYDMSKKFREKVLPESSEMRKMSGGVLLTGILLWFAFLVVWLYLLLSQARQDWQVMFLNAYMAVAVFFLIAAFARSSVPMGYFSVSVRYDVDTLGRALALPDFPPEMLEQLQNPQVRGGPYTYLLYRFEAEK